MIELLAFVSSGLFFAGLPIAVAGLVERSR